MTDPRTTPIFATLPGNQLRCFNPRCGHVWMQRATQPPFRCPRCQSRHWYNPSYPFHTRKLQLRAPEALIALAQEATKVDPTENTPRQEASLDKEATLENEIRS